MLVPNLWKWESWWNSEEVDRDNKQYIWILQNIDPLANLSSSKQENKIEMGVEKPSGDYDDNREEGDDDDEGYVKEESSKLLLQEEHGVGGKSKLDRYVIKVLNQLVKFDIWWWWRVHTSKYQVVSQLVRDVLAIPISTVAPKFTFSTWGLYYINFVVLKPRELEAFNRLGFA